MTSHIHLVGTPALEDSPAKAIGSAHLRYSQYVNRRHGRSGDLWQNRFFSCALDKVHVWRALYYVERNPVRAKMVRGAWRYLLKLQNSSLVQRADFPFDSANNILRPQ